MREEAFGRRDGARSRYLDELRGHAARLGFTVEASGKRVTVTYPNWDGMSHRDQASVSRCIDDLRTFDHYLVETVHGAGGRG